MDQHFLLDYIMCHNHRIIEFSEDQVIIKVENDNDTIAVAKQIYSEALERKLRERKTR